MDTLLQKYYSLYGGNTRTVRFHYFNEDIDRNITKTFTINNEMTFEQLKNLLREQFNLSHDFYIQLLFSRRTLNNNDQIPNVIENMNQILHDATYIINRS